MIAGSLNNAQPVLEWLGGLSAQVEIAIGVASADITDQILAVADRNLSGGVLKSRTGTLRASLGGGVEQSGGRLAAFITAGAPYAGYQEFGFTGIETVRAGTRKQSTAFGRAIAPVEAPVRAHERRVDYPGHSFLRTALADIAPDIQDRLAAAVAKVLQP